MFNKQGTLTLNPEKWCHNKGRAMWQVIFKDDMILNFKKNYPEFDWQVCTNGHSLRCLRVNVKRDKPKSYKMQVEDDQRINFVELVPEPESATDQPRGRPKADPYSLNCHHAFGGYMQQGPSSLEEALDKLDFIVLDPNLTNCAAGTAISANMSKDGNIDMIFIPFEIPSMQVLRRNPIPGGQSEGERVRQFRNCRHDLLTNWSLGQGLLQTPILAGEPSKLPVTASRSSSRSAWTRGKGQEKGPGYSVWIRIVLEWLWAWCFGICNIERLSSPILHHGLYR